MKSKWIPTVAVVGLIVVVMVGYSACKYNSLVNSEEEVDGTWAQVENVLKRRADLIPNLVETVKGFAAQEKEIFTAVADARSRLLAAKGPAEAAEANAGLTSSLGRLLMISEQYPSLKSNENFLRLQDELAGTENRIAVERKRYNDAVKEYNVTIRRFPGSVFAGMFGFDKKEYFEVQEADKQVPQVKF
jgi:LemA protein